MFKELKMSKFLGKKIKVIAVIIGAVGAVACLVMAFLSLSNYSDYAGLFSWIFLAIAFLLLMLPMFVIGSMIIELNEQREKIQLLSDKLAKVSKTVMHESIDKYSPSGKIRLPQQSQAPIGRDAYQSQDVPNSGSYGISTQPRFSSKADDFTRSLTPQQAESGGAVSMDALSFEPSEALRGAFRKTSSEIPQEPSFATTGLNTYEVNRRSGKITKNIASDMATIAAGGLHSAVVFSSGRVAAFGLTTYGQCNVENWGNIVAVAAGNHHTVGLMSNGRCVATGYNGYGQCNVESWTNICQIAAGIGHSVGLCENGTCVATGYNGYGQCNVQEWHNVVAIAGKQVAGSGVGVFVVPVSFALHDCQLRIFV